MIDAAETIMLCGGWKALTARALGDELGLSAPALYRHFSGMDELVSAVVERRYAEFLAWVAAWKAAARAADSAARRGRTGDAREEGFAALVADCAAFVRYWAERRELFDLFRDWLSDRGALGWNHEAVPDPLDADLAAARGVEDPGDAGARRSAWALRAFLFGLACAVVAEAGNGGPDWNRVDASIETACRAFVRA